jgi:hypothetical protein
VLQDFLRFGFFFVFVFLFFLFFVVRCFVVFCECVVCAHVTDSIDISEAARTACFRFRRCRAA